MRVLILLLAALNIFSCSEKKEVVKEVPEVFVVSIEEQPYRPSRGFNGRIRSSNDVDIQAQVSGELVAIHFTEGDTIHAGDALFDIDPAPYKAELAKTKGDLARAKAAQSNAEKNFERGKKLVKDGFISAAEFDELETRALDSKASVQTAEAAVEKAQLNLNFTSIKAPQDGRVGRSKPATGDIVGPTSGPLTTLVGQGGMDVVFQLPERLLISLRHSNRIKPEDVVVKLQLPDGSDYSETGKISYFSNRVDPNTGTLEAMASMPNPSDVLRPGLFVKVILQLDKPLMGLVVPQAAVQVDQQGTYVLAVDESNTVTRKNLTTGERLGEHTLVNSGLDAGDQVIIRGVQQARVGDTVKKLPYIPATAAHEGETSDQ